MKAANEGHTQLVRILLESKANVELTDKDGQVPDLHPPWLLANRAHRWLTDLRPAPQTALIKAGQAQQEEVMKLLMEAVWADADTADEEMLKRVKHPTKVVGSAIDERHPEFELTYDMMLGALSRRAAPRCAALCSRRSDGAPR
jgi:hypothetical protein